ncbi:MAG: sigma-54 dependent transcriptional regulator [Planctomycetes bacterium]|nr:sigma-54 dependent transcriptional regulator [Planctomycetota bacterium]
MKRKQHVLVVDDEKFVADSIAEILEAEGWKSLTAESAGQALALLGSRQVDLVVTDLSMPGGDGLGLLSAIKERGMQLPVILLTGVGKVADAVLAIKQGAYDFIQKPVDPEQFILVVTRALEHQSLMTQVVRLADTLDSLRAPRAMLGASRWYKEILGVIEQVAQSDATVLITGESGTGKELVAMEIHQRSRRARSPLVRVNCAAISENLFESEFFGHRRGSFTSAAEDRAGRFAEAEGGTLVLDEIGTLRPPMQAKLLRVLESGEYQVVGESSTRVADVRVIAVTNEDLAARVQEGAFRADLYYRLNVFPISVPPLRERKEDVAVIAAHFCRRYREPRSAAAGTQGKAGGAGGTPPLDPALAEVLASYDWPGNVRELRNVIERAMIYAGNGPLTPALVRGILEAATATSPAAVSGGGDLHLRTRLDALEKELVAASLQRTAGRKKESAQLLGIDPKNFGYYLRKHGIAERGAGAREEA